MIGHSLSVRVFNRIHAAVLVAAAAVFLFAFLVWPAVGADAPLRRGRTVVDIAADGYRHRGQVLDAGSGGYLRVYDVFGTNPGLLNVSCDALPVSGGRAVVANYGNGRVESIDATPQ